MEQPIQVKCHICGESAKHVYSYARFNAQESLLGVIHRGVCKPCLNAYIDQIKAGRRNKGSDFFWIIVFLPFGALLAALAKSLLWQIAGIMLIALAVLMPIAARVATKREAIRARRATPEQNELKYSEVICRDDAQSTSRQHTLIPLKEQYAAEDYPASRIVEETGVGRSTAVLIKDLTQKTMKCRRCV